MTVKSALQIELWQPLTVAQVVYGEWMWQYRNMYSSPNWHPAKITQKTAEYFDHQISEQLIDRIVHVQGKWYLRKFIRRAGKKS